MEMMEIAQKLREHSRDLQMRYQIAPYVDSDTDGLDFDTEYGGLVAQDDLLGAALPNVDIVSMYTEPLE